ncbi:Uncharacterized protein APZ42_015245 [Daphnia magna]|uniref:Uncharacterized protein n=1 Tax=Daphnia magna TaxID=35525 RepID=A0A162PAR7_9CRUS|nr:Uncharacterized protein APZ42_015245 [Daphnia magna]
MFHLEEIFFSKLISLTSKNSSTSINGLMNNHQLLDVLLFLSDVSSYVGRLFKDNLSRSSARPRLPKEIPFDEEFHQLNEAFPKRRKANI